MTARSDIAAGRAPDRADERVFDGLGVGPGVAIGTVYAHDAGQVSVPEYRLPVSRLPAEQKRFRAAVSKAGRQIEGLRGQARAMNGAAGEELGYLLEAYGQMLKGSRLVRGVEETIQVERLNAEAAVQREIAAIAEGFATVDDPYIASRLDDIKDVGARLIRCLTRSGYKPFSRLPRNAVVVADDLSPADTALMDPKTVHGFATVVGGPESHTAIMARSLGIPAVVGVVGLAGAASAGDSVVVDGLKGRVILNPTKVTLDRMRKQRADYLRYRRGLGRLKGVPAVTRDGIGVSLQANIELPSEIDAVIQSGAEGIGLFRTEFLYMNCDEPPSVESQTETLTGVIKAMKGKPVTIRTLDAGSDKVGRCLKITPGPNPALGMRAVRLAVQRPEVIERQFEAILRAAAHGPVRVLLPMISTTAEMTAMRGCMERVAARLRAERVPLPDPLPPVGVMIEVPAAALSADALALKADFFSIGTNDLTQYALAIDRGDEAVAHLYDPTHPAVLRLIQFATEAAHRAGIPVGLCGEMAGEPRYTALLLGLGIRDLSMTAMTLPRVKQRIRKMDMMAATGCARMIMMESGSERIAEVMSRFNDGL